MVITHGIRAQNGHRIYLRSDRYPLQGPEVAYDIWAIHALHKNNETTNETIDNVKTIVSAIV